MSAHRSSHQSTPTQPATTAMPVPDSNLADKAQDGDDGSNEFEDDAGIYDDDAESSASSGKGSSSDEDDDSPSKKEEEVLGNTSTFQEGEMDADDQGYSDDEYSSDASSSHQSNTAINRPTPQKAASAARSTSRARSDGLPRPALRLARPTDKQIQPIPATAGLGGRITSQEANKKAQLQFMKQNGMLSPLLASPWQAGKVQRRTTKADQRKRTTNAKADPPLESLQKTAGSSDGVLNQQKGPDPLMLINEAIPMHGGGAFTRKVHESPAVRAYQKDLDRLFQKDPAAYYRQIGTLPVDLEGSRSKAVAAAHRDRATKVPINFAGTAQRNVWPKSASPGPAYALPSMCFPSNPRGPGCNLGKKPPEGSTPRSNSTSLLEMRRITPGPQDYKVVEKWGYSGKTEFPNQIMNKEPRWKREKPKRLLDTNLSDEGEDRYLEQLSRSSQSVLSGLTRSATKRNLLKPGLNGSTSSLLGSSKLKDWYE